MKVALFANTDWYLFNFCSSLALELQDIGYEVILISPSGVYGHRILDLGLDWRPVPLSRKGLNPIAELNFVAWLMRFLKSNEIDMVHCFTIKCCIYGSVASRLLRRRMVVNTISGLGFIFSSDSFRARILRPIVKALMKITFSWKNSKLIVLNSDDYRWFLFNNILRESQLSLLLGAGIDCSKFNVRREYPVAYDGLRVLMASRLLRDKGVYEYIASARAILNSVQKIEFLLAGTPDEGNPSSVSVEEVKGWVTEGIVKWLGHVEDMPKLLNSIHIFVLPSYREGLPTGLTEAASCELAIIATDVPGCRDVIDDMENGLLVPAKSPDALSKAILRLYYNETERDEFGKAARKKALDCFEMSVINRKTLEIYKYFGDS